MTISETQYQSGGLYAAMSHPKHRRTFTVLVVLLVAALAFSGCHSTYPLAWADDPDQPLPADRSIEVTLIDKAVIGAEPFHYLEVREPAEFRGAIPLIRFSIARHFRPGVVVELPI